MQRARSRPIFNMKEGRMIAAIYARKSTAETGMNDEEED
jgi:hypothetical protein